MPDPGGRGADSLADLGRAGEGELVDAGMGDDRLPGLTFAGDDVDDALRQADAVTDFGEEQGRQQR